MQYPELGTVTIKQTFYAARITNLKGWKQRVSIYWKYPEKNV
jgi:hypothetical protein